MYLYAVFIPHIHYGMLNIADFVEQVNQYQSIGISLKE